MRTIVRLFVGAAVATAALTACSNPSSDDDARFGAPTQDWEFAAESDQSPDDPDPSPVADDPEPTTTPEPTTQPEPEFAPGTRQNPAGSQESAVFTTAEGEIDVWAGPAIWDASGLIAAENQFNDPPADGMTQVLVPVTVSYTGQGSVEPYYDIEVVYLADNGRSFESGYAVIPDALRDVNELYDGGTATGNLMFEVPTDQVPGGLWGISYGWNNDALWFEAA
ncbi:hypothetical protein CZ771_02200 [Actinomycetales bacterium JB111]|nr:hypothetical protein CZ771_02200 [Actinomycetales bacterium JB111]